MFKDALLQKNGIAKVWWEEGETATREGSSARASRRCSFILADPDVEPIAYSEYRDSGVVIEPNGLPIETAVTYHDLVVKRRRKSGAVRIMTVPPEEFLIGRRRADRGGAVRRAPPAQDRLGVDRDGLRP